MKRVGITGASGFIGKHLIKKFLNEGYLVNAYVRDTKKIDFLAEKHGDKLNVFQGDILDKEKLSNFAEESDFVVHLAAGTSGPYEDYFDSTVKGSELIFKTCEEKKVKKLVYISSISVYDLSRVKKSIATEETAFDPHLDLRGWYAKTKALGEREISSRFKKSSLPTIITARPRLRTEHENAAYGLRHH